MCLVTSVCLSVLFGLYFWKSFPQNFIFCMQVLSTLSRSHMYIKVIGARSTAQEQNTSVCAGVVDWNADESSNDSSVLWLCWSLIVCSQCRHEQDQTVLSCPCRQCEHNWRQDKMVLSCFDPVSNFQVFSSPQYIWDWTVANGKLGWDKTTLSGLVANSVHAANTDKTRPDCLVLSVSVVWTSYYRLHLLMLIRYFAVFMCF